MEPAEAGGEISLRWPARALTAFSLVGLLAVSGALPGGALAVSGSVVFLFGLALPLAARVAPRDTPALLVFLLSTLLSPVLSGAVYLSLLAVVGPERALAGTFAIAAVLPIAAAGRGVDPHPLGPSDRGALLLAAALAALTALFLLAGTAPRVSYHGLLHSSVLLAVDRGVPPENPWLAGTTLSYYWFHHGVAALLARSLALAPTQALALVNVWAALALPLALYACAVALRFDARRALLGTVLALLGLNALGGWIWIAQGVPWSTPRDPIELFQLMAHQVARDGTTGRPLWDPRLAFGLSKLGNLTSYAASLATLAGGWAAACRCAARGEPRWAALCGVLHGASLAFNPVMGAAGIGATALAVMVAGESRAARARVLASLFVFALPGLALVALASAARTESVVELAFSWQRVLAAIAPLAPLLPFALVAARPGASASATAPSAERAALAVLACAAFAPVLIYPFVELAEGNEYKLLRIAALPMGVLAGVGLIDAFAAGGGARLAAIFLGLPLAIGALAGNALGTAGYLAFARVDLPIEERPLTLLPATSPMGSPGEASRSAYAWLRARVAPLPERPVLVVNVTAGGPLYGAPPGHRFTTQRNLHGHEAAAFSGLALFTDRDSPMVESHPEWSQRLACVRELYVEPTWSEAHRAGLWRVGRPVVVLVTAADRAANPMLEAKLESHGFALAARLPGAAFYASPPDLAASLAPKRGASREPSQ